MSNFQKGPLSRQRIGLVSAGVVVLGLLAGVPGAQAAGTTTAAKGAAASAVTKAATYKDGRYIVVLREPAAASYDGSNSRFAATRAAGGSQFRADTPAVRAYTSHLRTAQQAVAKDAGATAAASYTIASNGFAAQLTGKQAADLARDSRVLFVTQDEARKPDAAAQTGTAGFLGMTGKKGAWEQNGGQKKAGDGIVVGDIDSGIWPESKSFSGKPLYTKPSTKWDLSINGTATRMEKADGTVFNGQCEVGQSWTINQCNTKIIGARYYADTFLSTTTPAERSPDEYISTRDGDGHGTHTASTAAGVQKGNIKVEGRKFGKISGMAPAAKLAVYKVCWEDTDPDTGGCYNSAILSAIDDAVSDGVDVLNFSISGALDTVIDPVELAFEGAAEAGIFVSASAGNSGPTASTVAHNSPWLTTVASSTWANFENTIVLGNKLKLVGASISDKTVGKTRLVLASASALAPATSATASLCGPNTLDPAKVSGKIVVCLRGTVDRVAKSAEVKRAGGKAMILVNPTASSLDADFHSVPTIHISETEGAVLFRYMQKKGADAKAAFKLSNTTKKATPLPQVSGFSSVGPALANDGDLLKPDIAAPGSSVLAAVSPPQNQGRKYDLYSGTSMAAPHITGLAAFMLGVHPSWTPMELKSAMMTSAKRLRTASGGLSNDVFASGAGQVQPKKFLDPGLFVTSDATDWRGFITGQGLNTGVPALAAKDLNGPSMAQSAVTGVAEFTRQFVASEKGKWKISFQVPGFSGKAQRQVIKSNRVNDVIDMKFTFTRTTAPVNEYAKGFVVLTGPTKLRLPVALRPVVVDAPADVAGTGVTSSTAVPIIAGTNGTLAVTAKGLTEGVTNTGAVAEGDADIYCVPVTAGTTTGRYELDSADDTADLDLYVLKSTDCAISNDDTDAATGATGSADELAVVDNPAAGNYLIVVDGFSAGSAGSPIDYTVDYYGIGGTPAAGNLTVTPNPVPVTQNKPTTFTLGWTGLDPAAHYYGELSYAGSADLTTVHVDTN